MAYYRINDISISGNTIQNVNTNGNIVLLPNGTGIVDTTTLQFDQLSLNNLSSATGVGSNDIFIVVSNPTGTSDTLKITGTTLRSSLLNQPAQLQFRQGLESERLLVTPATGEPIWITDTKRLFIGDGSTVGGIGVSMSGHTHLASDITNFSSGVNSLVSGIYAPLTGTLNQFGSTSSLQLASIINDESGSGLVVFNNSPTFTGIPLTPTATSGTNTNQIASTAFVRTEISNLISSAPSTLDTLNELASALGNDPNFATTVTNTLATKVSATGTTNYVSKFSGAQTLVNGLIYDDGNRIGIGTTNPSIISILHILGNEVLEGDLISTGSLIVSSGSASAPSYEFVGDPNTGAFSPLADTFAISTSGIERARINNIGNMGIGTTAPPHLLTVSGASTTAISIQTPWAVNQYGQFRFDTSVGSASLRSYIPGDSTNGLQVFTYGAGSETAKMTILGGGNVGIATTTPSGQLHVIGSGIFSTGIVVGDGSATSPSIAFNSWRNTGFSAPGSGILEFTVNGSKGMRLSQYNTLGINLGTASALGTLHVRGNGSNPAATTDPLILESSVGSGAIVRFKDSASNDWSMGLNPNGSIRAGTGSGNFAITKIVSNTGIPYVTVDTSGNLGIGTVSPSGKLHVIGSGIISSTGTVAPNALLSVYSSISGDNVFNVEGTNGSLFSVVDNLSGSLMSVNNNAGLPVFEVFSDDRIVGGRFGKNDWVVSSGGNIGIGTGVPTFKLHIIGTGNFTENLLINGTGVSLSGHSHIISNISGLQNSLDSKANLSGATFTGPVTLSGITAILNAPSINSTTLNSTNVKVNYGELTITSGSLAVVPAILSFAVCTINSSGHISAISGNFVSGLTVNNTGVSLIGHTHTASQITDFNEAVDDRIGSGLFVGGTGINLNYNDTSNSFTINVTGLITNPSDGCILTSKDSSTLIDAESNLTFNSNNLFISSGLTAATGNFTTSINGTLLNIDNISIDGNTISSTATNSGIILQTNGTGALRRDSGGNARGQYAVDWQNTRSTGTMVAGGSYSVIGGGRNNRTSDQDSVICGGTTNQITGLSYSSSIVGGEANSISSDRGFIGGGSSNTITKTYATIAGGLYNQVNISGSWGFVGGGANNKAQGPFSVVCGGGYDLTPGGNTAAGRGTVIGGGFNNIVSGQYSAILGGENNNDGNYSNVFILGSNITATQADTTYVQNLDISSTGDIDTLKINKFYHNNLSVATGVSDSDLLITIVNPTGSSSTQVISGSGLRNSLLNQPAVLRFRQGTNAERLLITPATGEPIWTTDTQRFYIGDGSTVGGDFIGPGPYTYAATGYTNVIPIHSTIGYASGDFSNILGGYNNTVSGMYLSVINGLHNRIIDNTGTTVSAATIVGGTGNLIREGLGCAIVGGYRNTVSGGSASTIVGGGDAIFGGNSIIGSRNFIGGGAGNNISGNNSIIVGGGFRGPTALYGNAVLSNFGFIGAGDRNTIYSGSWMSNIVGGYLCSISSGCSASTIGGGYVNNISQVTGITVNMPVFGSINLSAQTIGGGYANNTAGAYSTIPGGYRGKTSHYGELSHAAGFFQNFGDAQHTILIARRSTTDNTANQVLFLNNDSLNAGETNYEKLTIAAKTTWTFEIKLSAYNDTDSAAAGWIFRGVIKRDGSNNTTIVGSIVTESWYDSAMNSTNASVVANDTDESLDILVTGLTSKNIRWVAVTDISQVSYGTP